MSNDDDDDDTLRKRQSHLRVMGESSPGACKPHAWKPRRACSCAVGAARTKPLPAASERSPAQVVISGEKLSFWLGEEKRLSVLTCLAGTGSVGSVSRRIMKKKSSQNGRCLVASLNS